VIPSIHEIYAKGRTVNTRQDHNRGTVVKDWYTDTQWNDIWHGTPRVPSVRSGAHAYLRDQQLYEPEARQFFRRKDDDLLVEVVWTNTNISVVQNVRTREWYSAYNMDFSTRRVVHEDGSWRDLYLLWTRVGRDEARVARRAYVHSKVWGMVHAVFPFLRRKDNASR
jgi:hypothetical protein